MWITTRTTITIGKYLNQQLHLEARNYFLLIYFQRNQMCNSDTSGIESGQSERHSSKESDSSFDSPERIIDVTKWKLLNLPFEKGYMSDFITGLERHQYMLPKCWWHYFLLNPASKSSICSSSVTIVHKLKKTLVKFDWPIAVNQSDLFIFYHLDTLHNLNEIVSYVCQKIFSSLVLF